MKRGRAIKTGGVGKPCISHVNLTRSLAEVWKVTPGTRPEKKYEHTPAQIAIRDGYAAGKTAQDIAGVTGLTVESVRTIAWRFGWKRLKARKAPVVRRPPYAGYDPTERL